MATPTVPTTEPTSFSAGDTQQWTRVFANYPPSDGWTLKYYFAGPSVWSASATADSTNTGYAITITSDTTKAFAEGVYRWRAVVEKGSGGTFQRWEMDRGAVTLEGNFSTTTGITEQEFAEQMVAAIQARLLDRTNADLESYGVAGRQAQKIKYTELAAHLGIWKAKLWRAQNPGAFAPSVAVRFRPTTGPINDQWDGQP